MAVVLTPKLVAPPSTPTPPGSHPASDQWVAPQNLVGCVDCDTCADLAGICASVAEEMYRLTGRKYGTRRALIRPTLVIPSSGAWWYGLTGWTWAGVAVFSGWDGYDLVLSGPVSQVHAVVVDGVPLDPSEYQLVGGRRLRRIGAAGYSISWPDCQDVGAADTLPGTFSVDYTYGVPVPPAGRRNARDWACQFARAGEDDCALPANVIRQTRQGTTQDFGGGDWMAPGGQTGLPGVDRWIRMVNRSGSNRQPSITSPDTMKGMVRG